MVQDIIDNLTITPIYENQALESFFTYNNVNYRAHIMFRKEYSNKCAIYDDNYHEVYNKLGVEVCPQTLKDCIKDFIEAEIYKNSNL
jgi:hypothetical protein